MSSITYHASTKHCNQCKIKRPHLNLPLSLSIYAQTTKPPAFSPPMQNRISRNLSPPFKDLILTIEVPFALFIETLTHNLKTILGFVKKIASDSKSCSGISLKTQELYVVVFVARYLNLFTTFISLYNTVMKVVFIGSSVAIVYCMRWHPAVKRSYDRDLDTFKYQFLVLASFLLALVLHDKFTLLEIFWAFSIYLEAVAILPQLVLLQTSGNVDNLTG